MKKLKLKARSPVWTYEKSFENDNLFTVILDFYDCSIGIGYRLGDSRRFFKLDLIFLHIDLWF